jgi:RNAse (barnase) inhibitor barstar
MNKDFKIILEISQKDDLIIGSASMVNILKKENYYLIKLKDFIKIDTRIIKENTLISFRINSQNSYFMQANCIENFNLKNSTINADLNSMIDMYYVNFYSKLLYSWSKDENKYFWNKLSTLRKKVWIDACFTWSGILNKKIKDNIYIDCLNVNQLIDLYCYLGDKFIGYRGYLGYNLDSLEDCLINIEHKSNLKIIFNNFSHLEKVLNTEKSFKKYKKDYTDILLDIFNQADFITEIN